MKFNEKRSYRTCPACLEKKATKTDMGQHLSQHCSVVRELRRRCLKGEVSVEEVRSRLEGYLETFEASKRRNADLDEVCNCAVAGHNFCDKIVELIDWENDIVHCKVGNRYFVR